MPEPAVDILRDLLREELMALIQRLFEEVRRLEAEIERLKQLPPTSHNSSQPPSRDWKADRSKRKRRKKVGAKAGHAKAERPLVDNPDKVVEAWVEACAHCGTELLDQVPERAIRRQVTELPEIKPLVIETRKYRSGVSGLPSSATGAVARRAGSVSPVRPAPGIVGHLSAS